MSTTIRLARHGRKKKPFFKIVVMDSRNKTRGRFKELLGFYDPITKETRLNMAAFQKWTKELGAKASERVLSIAKTQQNSSEASKA